VSFGDQQPLNAMGGCSSVDGVDGALSLLGARSRGLEEGLSIPEVGFIGSLCSRMAIPPKFELLSYLC
jgi:hypothetical protein